ncbi:MAG TPA: signal peptidase I [Epulopiscium sp.]|nr:signal peptidase I [Candidatus Epulonipiscium sp.]
MKTNKKLIESLNKKPKTLLFWKGYILDWVIDLVIAGIIVLIITTFAFQNMYVVGSSMNPTLKNGEMVLINKLTYLKKDPNRNDIVAFKHVDSSNNEMNIVKRIIGVPGDTIEMVNNVLYLNDERFDHFVKEYNQSDPFLKGNMDYPIKVPENAYFVLGDNKANSVDSRYLEIGMIPKQEIEGKIFIRIWPFWKIKLL